MAPKFKPQRHRVTLTGRRHLTPDILELGFQLEGGEKLEFEAGQFVNVYIPREEERPAIRAYSIASPLDDPERLVICLDTDAGDGIGVSYLKGLDIGDQITIKGPVGIFKIREDDPHDILIACHVSALGMCLAMAEAALRLSGSRRVTLVHALKPSGGAYYVDELRELARTYDRFHPVLTLPGGGPHWRGPTTSLVDEVTRRLENRPTTTLYLCGLGPMVTELSEAARKLGLPKDRIVAEKWSKAA